MRGKLPHTDHKQKPIASYTLINMCKLVSVHFIANCIELGEVFNLSVTHLEVRRLQNFNEYSSYEAMCR